MKTQPQTVGWRVKAYWLPLMLSILLFAGAFVFSFLLEPKPGIHNAADPAYAVKPAIPDTVSFFAVCVSFDVFLYFGVYLFMLVLLLYLVNICCFSSVHHFIVHCHQSRFGLVFGHFIKYFSFFIIEMLIFVAMLIAMSTCVCTTEMLKVLLGRPRPYAHYQLKPEDTLFNSNYQKVFTHLMRNEAFRSFPSGHTSSKQNGVFVLLFISFLYLFLRTRCNLRHDAFWFVFLGPIEHSFEKEVFYCIDSDYFCVSVGRCVCWIYAS